MGQPWDRQAHTLAQFARRAGISEGRARALYATTPSGLPRPDRTDADDRPLWWASTIDTWCARTGRTVNEDSVWLFRAPAASTPAVELQRGVVTLERYGYRTAMYAIVWDTERGHVIYLQPLNNTGDHRDWLAKHAAELIEPRWWSSAVVVMPLEEMLGAQHTFAPLAYVYRLTTTANDRNAGAGDRGSGGTFGGMRRWFARTVPEMAGAAEPRAVWSGQLDLADIATAIGHQIPMWLSGTATSANGEQTLSYNRTFTIPDTVTEWPAVQQRLIAAIEAGMPEQFPAGFAALAVDAAEGLEALRSAHEATATSGPGWYLVCRPAKPAPDIALEQTISGAALVTDLDIVTTELTELRALEGELDHDAPVGDAYREATTLLAWQLRQAARDAGTITITSLGHDYVAVADDDLLVYSAPWNGPVVEAWRKNLTPLDDVAPLLRLRRIQRLLGDLRAEQVQETYRDNHGRYVLVVEMDHGGIWSRAEWPVGLHQVDDWTDDTVLAGDDEDGTVTTLLALTPTGDGRMRTDPIPLPPNSDRDAFAYGYSGGTPITMLEALLRCALGDSPDVGRAYRLAGEAGAPTSQLWAAISTTKGPLRLSWPQVKMWAQADVKRARILEQATAKS